MQIIILSPQDTRYPAKLRAWYGKDSLPLVHLSGNIDILCTAHTPLSALFCSRDCPGSLLLPAMDLVTMLREKEKIVISGFHSPLEQEGLHILLRGKQSVIICPARSIHTMRMLSAWKQPSKENRLLVLSPFPKEKRRISRTLAWQRNQLVVSLADEIFIIYAPPASKITNLGIDAIKNNKKVYAIHARKMSTCFSTVYRRCSRTQLCDFKI